MTANSVTISIFPHQPLRVTPFFSAIDQSVTSERKIYLIPTAIAEQPDREHIEDATGEISKKLKGVTHFLAEDLRMARRFLKNVLRYDSLESIHIDILDKRTDEMEIPIMMEPLKAGHSLGILSKSGAPCIADPGAAAVRYAHAHNFKVVPLSGCSSIFMALMASGLSGQQFAFHGYLPIATHERSRQIRKLEKESNIKQQTQIFIETPYRNNALFRQLLEALRAETLLCIATDITGREEEIKTFPVKKWKKLNRLLPKRPSVFLFLSK